METRRIASLYAPQKKKLTLNFIDEHGRSETSEIMAIAIKEIITLIDYMKNTVKKQEHKTPDCLYSDRKAMLTAIENVARLKETLSTHVKLKPDIRLVLKQGVQQMKFIGAAIKRRMDDTSTKDNEIIDLTCKLHNLQLNHERLILSSRNDKKQMHSLEFDVEKLKEKSILQYNEIDRLEKQIQKMLLQLRDGISAKEILHANALEVKAREKLFDRSHGELSPTSSPVPSDQHDSQEVIEMLKKQNKSKTEEIAKLKAQVHSWQIKAASGMNDSNILDATRNSMQTGRKGPGATSEDASHPQGFISKRTKKTSTYDLQFHQDSLHHRSSRNMCNDRVYYRTDRDGIHAVLSPSEPDLANIQYSEDSCEGKTESEKMKHRISLLKKSVKDDSECATSVKDDGEQYESSFKDETAKRVDDLEKTVDNLQEIIKVKEDLIECQTKKLKDEEDARRKSMFTPKSEDNVDEDTPLSDGGKRVINHMKKKYEDEISRLKMLLKQEDRRNENNKVYGEKHHKDQVMDVLSQSNRVMRAMNRFKESVATILEKLGFYEAAGGIRSVENISVENLEKANVHKLTDKAIEILVSIEFRLCQALFHKRLEVSGTTSHRKLSTKSKKSSTMSPSETARAKFALHKWLRITKIHLCSPEKLKSKISYDGRRRTLPASWEKQEVTEIPSKGLNTKSTQLIAENVDLMTKVKQVSQLLANNEIELEFVKQEEKQKYLALQERYRKLTSNYEILQKDLNKLVTGEVHSEADKALHKLLVSTTDKPKEITLDVRSEKRTASDSRVVGEINRLRPTLDVRSEKHAVSESTVSSSHQPFIRGEEQSDWFKYDEAKNASIIFNAEERARVRRDKREMNDLMETQKIVIKSMKKEMDEQRHNVTTEMGRVNKEIATARFKVKTLYNAQMIDDDLYQSLGVVMDDVQQLPQAHLKSLYERFTVFRKIKETQVKLQTALYRDAKSDMTEQLQRDMFSYGQKLILKQEECKVYNKKKEQLHNKMQELLHEVERKTEVSLVVNISPAKSKGKADQQTAETELLIRSTVFHQQGTSRTRSSIGEKPAKSQEKDNVPVDYSYTNHQRQSISGHPQFPQSSATGTRNSRRYSTCTPFQSPVGSPPKLFTVLTQLPEIERLSGKPIFSTQGYVSQGLQFPTQVPFVTDQTDFDHVSSSMQDFLVIYGLQSAQDVQMIKQIPSKSIQSTIYKQRKIRLPSLHAVTKPITPERPKSTKWPARIKSPKPQYKQEITKLEEIDLSFKKRAIERAYNKLGVGSTYNKIRVVRSNRKICVSPTVEGMDWNGESVVPLREIMNDQDQPNDNNVTV